MKKVQLLYLIQWLVLVAKVASEKRTLHRSKRYLVYPDGAPARAQFILGLGIPVDIQDQSITVGTVIKFQYDLPTNSSEYTSRIYGFANTIESRDMTNNIEEDEDVRKQDREKHTSNDNYEENDVDHDNNTLTDIVFDNENETRNRRAYNMEGSKDNLLKMNDGTKAVPSEGAIKGKNMFNKEYREKEPESESTNRWDLYRIMEQTIERYGYSGRPCLLRTVCEAAEIPFTHKNGLLGEITHILFTPSSSAEPPSHHTDNEYHAAERLGRELGVDCGTLFPECEASLLETFTRVGLDTLHTFGF